MKKEFVPTQEQIEAARLVFLHMAWVETVRPIVEGYQRKVLSSGKYQVSPEWREGRMCPAELVITDPKNTYLMTDEDFAEYHAECVRERNAAGLKVESDEFCPLLVAEHELRESQWLLCDVMESVTGMKREQVTRNLEIYRKYLDLTLRFLAPYVDKEAA